jgi:hypothetical protein
MGSALSSARQCWYPHSGRYGSGALHSGKRYVDESVVLSDEVYAAMERLVLYTRLEMVSGTSPVPDWQQTGLMEVLICPDFHVYSRM